MSQADEDSQAQADDLVAGAGKVTPLSGLVMALAPDRTLTVAEGFEDSAQAKENLPRTRPTRGRRRAGARWSVQRRPRAGVLAHGRFRQ